MMEATILQILSNMSLGALSVLLGYAFMYQVMLKLVMPALERLCKQNEEMKETLQTIKNMLQFKK